MKSLKVSGKAGSLRVLFLNQSAGPMFMDLVNAAVAEIRDVGIISGGRPRPYVRSLEWMKAPPMDPATSASRLTSWLRYFVTASLKVLFATGKPMLFIVTNPPFLPILGWAMNLIRGQKYVLLYYDLYPEVLIRFAGLSQGSVIARAWQTLNKLSIRRAEWVLTISPSLLSALEGYTRRLKNPPPLSLVTTWVDANRIRPVAKEDNAFAVRHGQVGKLTILYSGNIGNTHDISMLVDVADQMKAIGDVHFIVISDSPARSALETRARAFRLDNMTFLPLQDEADFPLSLACGDIGIVALARGAEELSLPSKTYFAMAAGSAVLAFCREQSDLGETLRRHECGFAISPGDTAAAVKLILEFKKDPALLKRYRLNARRAAAAEYDRTRCVPRVMNAIEAALRSGLQK